MPASASAPLYRWLETGEADEQNDVDTPYRELWEAIQNAKAAFELRVPLQIEKAANDGSWQAAAWKLERKHPQRWGRKSRIEMITPEAFDDFFARQEEQLAELEQPAADQ